MSIEITGIYQGDVWFVDATGPGSIPARILPTLSHDAAMRDAAKASWLGRSFDRDDLAALRRDLLAGDLPQLDSCTRCVDQPATGINAKGAPVCEAHQDGALDR